MSRAVAWLAQHLGPCWPYAIFEMILSTCVWVMCYYVWRMRRLCLDYAEELRSAHQLTDAVLESYQQATAFYDATIAALKERAP